MKLAFLDSYITNGKRHLVLDFDKIEEPSIATEMAVRLFLQQKYACNAQLNKHQKNLEFLIDREFEYAAIWILQEQLKCFDTNHSPFNAKLFQQMENEGIEYSRALDLCRGCFEWANRLARTEKDREEFIQMRTYKNPYTLWVSLMSTFKLGALNCVGYLPHSKPLSRREKNSEAWKDKLDGSEINSLVGQRRHFLACMTGTIKTRDTYKGTHKESKEYDERTIHAVKFELGHPVSDLMAVATLLAGFREVAISEQDIAKFKKLYWNPFEKAYEAHTSYMQNGEPSILYAYVESYSKKNNPTLKKLPPLPPPKRISNHMMIMLRPNI